MLNNTLSVVVIAFLFALSACVSDKYANTFVSNPEVSANIENLIYQSNDQEPQIIESENIKDELVKLEAEGYVILGSSAFRGTKGKNVGFVTHAKTIGATHVLVMRKYLRTEKSSRNIKVSNGGSVESRIVPGTNILRPQYTNVVTYKENKKIFQNIAVYLVKVIKGV